MPVPKFRTSASKRDMRRSHHALKAPTISYCPNCDNVKRSHAVCDSCGHYNGRVVLEIKQEQTQWNGEGLEPDAQKS